MHAAVAAVKAADIPKPAKVEDKLEAEEDMAETQEDEGEDDMVRISRVAKAA